MNFQSCRLSTRWAIRSSSMIRRKGEAMVARRPMKEFPYSGTPVNDSHGFLSLERSAGVELFDRNPFLFDLHGLLIQRLDSVL